ncbi:MAG: O-antigen ligase family protein [Smithella sp.]|nr:O-antigen ligase family protein [Smithella sp.]
MENIYLSLSYKTDNKQARSSSLNTKSYMLSIPLKKNQIIGFIILSAAWLIRNTFFIRQRSGELYSAVDQAAMIQIGIVLILGLIIILSNPVNFWTDLKGTSGRWWIIIYVFGLISYFWSNNPSFTAYRAIEYLILSTALTLLILNSTDEAAAERNFLLIAWSVLACQVLSPLQSLSVLMTGMRNNALGASAVMIACYSWGEYLTTSRPSKRILMISAIISTFFVLISLSTSSWWSLLVGGAIIALISRRKILFFALLLLLIITLFYVDQTTIDQIVYRQKAGMTFQQALTSRDILWQDYWSAFQEKPWLGYGFGIVARELGEIYTTNTHNYIFAIAVGMGGVGFAIFIIYLLKLFFEMLRNLKFGSLSSVGLFAALIASFVNGQSISFIGESWSPSSYVFVCLFSLHLYNYLVNKYSYSVDSYPEYVLSPTDNQNPS